MKKTADLWYVSAFSLSTDVISTLIFERESVAAEYISDSSIAYNKFIIMRLTFTFKIVI